jgi:hypothetical protein
LACAGSGLPTRGNLQAQSKEMASHALQRSPCSHVCSHVCFHLYLKKPTAWNFSNAARRSGNSKTCICTGAANSRSEDLEHGMVGSVTTNRYIECNTSIRFWQCTLLTADCMHALYSSSSSGCT